MSRSLNQLFLNTFINVDETELWTGPFLLPVHNIIVRARTRAHLLPALFEVRCRTKAGNYFPTAVFFFQSGN